MAIARAVRPSFCLVALQHCALLSSPVKINCYPSFKVILNTYSLPSVFLQSVCLSEQSAVPGRPGPPRRHRQRERGSQGLPSSGSAGHIR